MSNSADKKSSLDEDSDVIELTEEVGPQDEGDEDLDELGLDMPEFRVPGSEPSDEEFDEADATQNLPPEAIEADLQEDLRATQEVEGAPASEREDDPPEEGTEEQGFDREQLVKTVRMEAFDRSQVELLDAARNWEVEGFLDDQRYAPDILVLPPRVLTKKWQDGARTKPNGAAPGGTAAVEDRSTLATTVQTDATERSDVDEDEEEAIELEPLEEEEATDVTDDDEPVELVPEPLDEAELEQAPVEPARPPPKPADDASARAQKPGRRRQDTAPLPDSEKPGPGKPGPPEDDDDLSGIVQELLDEEPADAETGPGEKEAEWFVDTFGEEYLRTLPKGIHNQTEREVDFIDEAFNLEKEAGARVLDLACGFGRHSIELARRGYEVAGLDLSMALLQRALSEAQRRSLSIKFIHGDMRELNFSGIFDACFCWQTSFGYFDDRVNLSVLEGVNRALKPGGRLLIDVLNRDYVIGEMPSRTWWEGIDCVFLEEVEFDNHESILQTKRSFIYEDGSPPKEFSSFIRLYSLHELKRFYRLAGFRPIEVSGEIHHRGNFLGPSSSRILLMGEKIEPE